MLTPILIASLSLPGPSAELPWSVLGRHRPLASPFIEVWTNRDDVFRRGDKVKMYFRTDVDGYVTVFRIDTDGRVRVLFPASPFEDNYARGGQGYQVDPRDDGYTFRVDDYPGQGYLFAVATLDPFVYQPLVRADHWDYRLIGSNGRITGDPYEAAGDLIGRIVPAHYADYTYDIVPYFVESRYEYPRFLCYDCHAYASYPYWDPYDQSCFKFRIVIYDDPYYYPTRVHNRTRVVYRRPTVLIPRYVFKDRTPADDYVVTIRERPVDDAGRRRVEPGATRRVLPGGTQIPTPKPTVTTDPSGRRTVPLTGDSQNERRATPATPTLERRDPARIQVTEPERRPSSDGPRRVEPDRKPASSPPVRRTEPPRTSTPPRATPPPPKKPDPPKRKN